MVATLQISDLIQKNLTTSWVRRVFQIYLISSLCRIPLSTKFGENSKYSLQAALSTSLFGRLTLISTSSNRSSGRTAVTSPFFALSSFHTPFVFCFTHIE